jgi:hypothetical protein
MSSARRIATTGLVALTAALVAAVPAFAAGTHGVGGLITDADTGLGVASATATWHGTTSPLPQATTDATGRYLFLGLEGGSTGTLSIAGPAGWDQVDLPNVGIPADAPGTQNVALHRNWSSAAGGAKATANDSSGAAGGCAPGAAIDGDRATGWSASAARPAADPPALTVELPQTIDVTGLVIDPTSACAHDAGAALGRYRVETSADGTSWATALAGELGSTDRGTATEHAPAANATGVRFVRLVLLSAQSPAAATIDVRELKVYGLGPNEPPTGTLATDAARTYIKQVVRLRAAFTDSDSTILRYLWDFDGDGTWDQATNGPAVSHVWAGPGTYHVTVGVRDFRGGLGTASLDLRVSDPSQPVEAVPQRKPLITFDPPLGIDLATRIACASTCRFTLHIVLTAKMARTLGVKHREVLVLRKATQGAGLGSWTVELPQQFIKKLRRAHLNKITLRVTATAVDQQGRRTTVKRWVTFR